MITLKNLRQALLLCILSVVYAASGWGQDATAGGSGSVSGLAKAQQVEPWSVSIAADGRHLELLYHGRVWVSRLRVRLSTGTQTLASDDANAKLFLARSSNSRESIVNVESRKTYQVVFRFTGPNVAVSLHGLTARETSSATVSADLSAGGESIQARLDGTEDDVQQMETGRAVSTLNNCVFDRFSDQALRVLARETRFTPTSAGYAVEAGGRLSDAPICGFDLVERVYSRRLPFYSPLDKKKWPQVPSGWCSFHFYGGKPSEEGILRNAEALAHDYGPFGLSHLLLDGGWQEARIVDSWTAGKWMESNERFPHGMKWLAERIKALGLKPGIWLSTFGTGDENLYNAHPDWFLHDEKGNAKLGSWFGTYVVDFSNPQVQRYLYEVYRKIAEQWGYDYFKLDGENQTRDLWAANRMRTFDPTLEPDIAFRGALSKIHDAMSLRPGVFFSACGPIYATESMGIAQSARLGGDALAFNGPNQDQDGVPSFWGVRMAIQGMRTGFYTHNIAWYGDPDAVMVRPPITDDEARTWVSILGLTGQLLMFGDDMPALPNGRRDLLRKILPVTDITPMELYPVAADRHIWVLHIARPVGSWAVAGLFNWENDGREVTLEDPAVYSIIRRNDALLGMVRPYADYINLGIFLDKAMAENQRLRSLANKPAGLQLIPLTAYLTPPPPQHFSIGFDRLGLDPDRPYVLFDFWKQKFLGKLRGEFAADLLPHACEVISIRPAADHPQLVGTDRHITMGGMELKDEAWDATRKQLRIKVELVENYPTTLTVYNAERDFKGAKAVAADLQTFSDRETVRVKLLSPKSGLAEVTLRFE
jgi:hypothetical protein